MGFTVSRRNGAGLLEKQSVQRSFSKKPGLKTKKISVELGRESDFFFIITGQIWVGRRLFGGRK